MRLAEAGKRIVEMWFVKSDVGLATVPQNDITKTRLFKYT